MGAKLANCRDLEPAKKLFDKMPNRNAVSYATIIFGFLFMFRIGI